MMIMIMDGWQQWCADPGDAQLTFGVVALSRGGYIALGFSSEHASMIGMDVAFLTKEVENNQVGSCGGGGGGGGGRWWWWWVEKVLNGL